MFNLLPFRTDRIPRIIHYVWVGGSPLPDPTERFIETWKKYNPGYKLMLWNEHNIDLTIPYIRNAHEHRKWANVSNFARLQAVYEYGGIYLDTDVEVLKRFDGLLRNKCFFGFQVKYHETDWVNQATFGAAKEHWFIKAALAYLVDHFEGNEQGNLSGPAMTTRLLREHGLLDYKDAGVMVKDIRIYPVRYFYPFSWLESYSPELITDDTYSIHYWAMQWQG